MYTVENFRTKKAMKEALAAGTTIRVFQPGPFPGKVSGRVSIEGPHYPEPHHWYADVEITDGVVTKINL